MSTLPKLKVSHNDKEPRNRLDLENIQTTTAPDKEDEDLDLQEEEEVVIE
jgi:hypothetical protein